ncbi:MAG: TRM11 family SAM-dependent methyltransferase [Candidatus Heimdallarchaeaceae archaeon]
MSISFNSFVKLGTNRNLSKAELSQILDSLKIEQVKYQDWKDYLLLSLGKNTQKKLVKKLEQSGSIIKFGNIEFKVGVSERKELNDNLLKIIDGIFIKYLPKKQKQLKLSLNIRTNDEPQKAELSKTIRNIIQNISQEKRFPVKVLPRKKEAYELTPFDYNKENLPTRGIELNLFVIKSKIYFGPTRWVTNPFKDIKQDEDRPVRFFTHGTSIKLSRTLVTLANIPFDGLMLDPFCGTGTILIEGLKQGLKVIGIDKDQKCIRSSKTNLHHFSEKYPSREKMKEKWRVQLLDSRKLTDVFQKKIDGVVTEPFLGPFLKHLPHIDEAQFTMKNLERLYTRVLAECNRLLKPGSRIVFIMPEYNYSLKRSVYPNVKSICEKTGLTLLEESKFFNIKFPVEIGRKHNVVARNLFIFESK